MNHLFGAILADDTIYLKTATGWGFRFEKGSLVNRIIGLVGIPHLGARIRSDLTMRNLDNAKNGERLLDAGCGVGFDSYLYAQKGYKVTATDVDPKKIKEARIVLGHKRGINIKFMIDDMERSKLIGKKFDKVILSQVLEHVRNPKEVLKNIESLLDQEGYAYVSFPSRHKLNKDSQERFGHVVHGFSPRTLCRLLKGTGLKINKIISFGNSTWGQAVFTFNYALYYITPILSGLFFPFLYPLVSFDSFIKPSGMPVGYIVVLKKN